MKLFTSLATTDPVIISLGRAQTALVEARTLSETKKIIDIAVAAEIYAKRQSMSQESIDYAYSIKIDALRKLGEMLQETPKNKGTKSQLSGKNSSGGTKMEPPEEATPSLKELGLDKKTSSIAQKLAKLPEKEFAQVRSGHETIAKALASVEAEKAQPKPTGSPISENEKRDEKQEDEPHYDPESEALANAHETVIALSEENTRLKDAIAAGNLPEAEQGAGEIIIELRARVKTLEATLAAVESTRDTLLNENAALKKQCLAQARKLKKFEGKGNV